MLIHLALAYAVSWLAALCGAGAVETVRLLTTGRLAPALDWIGAACVAWAAAPLLGPAWAGTRLWRWARRG